MKDKNRQEQNFKKVRKGLKKQESKIIKVGKKRVAG